MQYMIYVALDLLSYYIYKLNQAFTSFTVAARVSSRSLCSGKECKEHSIVCISTYPNDYQQNCIGCSLMLLTV